MLDLVERGVNGAKSFRFPARRRRSGEVPEKARKISSPSRPPLAVPHEVEVVRGLWTLQKHQR